MSITRKLPKMGILPAFVFIFIFQACASKAVSPRHFATTPASEAKLAVSSSEPLVGKAAVQMMKAGGNIIDATVAASFVLSVIRPQSTGIGGGGFLIYHDKKLNLTEAWDFREVAPLAAKSDMYLVDGTFVPEMSLNGAKAVAVPGLVAGLYDLHKKHGKLSWAQVLQPAIEAAEQGVPASAHFVRATTGRLEILSKDAELLKLFTRDGKPMLAGDIYKQPDLAKTLRGIAAEGKDYFYKGEFANALTEWMKANGGLITKEDLAGYQVKVRTPLVSEWRGYKIVTMPPPSSGGIHLLQILSIVDFISDDYKKSFSEIDATGKSIGNKVADVEAFKRAYIDRAYYLGDPDFYKVPQDGLLNADYLKKRAEEIERRGITPPEEILPWSNETKDKQTSHLSLIDSEGNAVSTTQTVNFHFGAAVMAPGTGVVLNDEMDDFSAKPGTANAYGVVGGEANKIEPGKRPLSSMTPTIVLSSDGSAKMALGAPGGSKIITQVYEVLSGILRDGETPADAVAKCRYHHQWTPNKLMMEAPCMERYKVLEKFYTLEQMNPPGELQIVGVDNRNNIYSAVDPRGVEALPVIWSGTQD